MKALIVFYKGTAPHNDVCETLSQLPWVNEIVEVHCVSGDTLATAVASMVNKPVRTTTDGDNAALYISGIVRSMDTTTLSIDVIKNLTLFENDHSNDVAEAFVRSASIIAQGSPISKEIVKKTGLTASARDTITKLYNAWKNG